MNPVRRLMSFLNRAPACLRSPGRSDNRTALVCSFNSGRVIGGIESTAEYDSESRNLAYSVISRSNLAGNRIIFVDDRHWDLRPDPSLLPPIVMILIQNQQLYSTESDSKSGHTENSYVSSESLNSSSGFDDK